MHADAGQGVVRVVQQAAAAQCALQVGGRTPVGGLPAWYDFELDRVVAVEPLLDRFRCAADFDPAAQRFGDRLVAVVLG